MATDPIAECGCEIRDVNGNLAVNTMKAIAFETNLIRKTGYRFLPEVDTLLDRAVPKAAGDPNEAENPRDYVEYMFGVQNTDVEATDFLASGATAEDAMVIDCDGNLVATEITQKNGGSLGCDPRSVTLVGGRNEYRGTHRQLPTVRTSCVCMLDFARTKDFPQYLRGVREAMPKESAVFKERDMLRQLMATAKYSTAEAGASKLQFTTGYFPHIPQGGPQIATFRRMRDILKQQGHPGNVEVPISLPGLISMMAHHYQVMGIQYQVAKWTSGEWPIQNGRFNFEGIDFVVCDNPIKGTLYPTAADTYKFKPLSTRKWAAGNGAGVVYDFNLDYDQPTVVCDGQEMEVYELVPIISSMAYEQRPFVMNDMGVAGTDTKAMMWSGTNVRVVSGADIPSNQRRLKFYWELDHVYKLIPKKPYLAGFVLVRTVTYPRAQNLIGLNGTNNLLSGQTITINPGSPQPSNSRADIAAGFNPNDEGVPRTVACDVENVVGKFYTQYSAVTSIDASSVVVCVERRGGSDGAATLAYTLDDGTGVAGTDYTDASGTLSWADGESGAKCVTVALPATARHGKTFVVNYGTATGATKASGASEDTTVTIHRPAHDYVLGASLTGALTGITADGGAFGIGASYAATAAGASALQDAINDLLGGNGVASVTFATDWNITITGTTVVFASATNGSDTVNFSQV